MLHTGTQLHSVMFGSGKHSPPHFEFTGKFTKCSWQFFSGGLKSYFSCRSCSVGFQEGFVRAAVMNCECALRFLSIRAHLLLTADLTSSTEFVCICVYLGF